MKSLALSLIRWLPANSDIFVRDSRDSDGLLKLDFRKSELEIGSSDYWRLNDATFLINFC